MSRHRGAPRRVLVLSEKYPPHYVGGYEIFCAEVVALLRDTLDCTVEVVTSDFGIHGPGDCDPADCECPGVHRILGSELLRDADFAARSIVQTITRRVMLSHQNQIATRRFLQDRHFDLCLCFKLWDTTFSPLVAVRDANIPLVMVACDQWVEVHRRYFGVKGLPRLRRLLSYGGYDFLSIPVDHYLADAQNLAQGLTDSGVDPDQVEVIHPITSLAGCSPHGHQDFGRELRLFHGGRLCAQKGPDLFVDCVAELVNRRPALQVCAHIYGHGEPGYVNMLQERISAHGLNDVVRLMPMLPEEDFLRTLGQYHAFVFPFRWDDPYPRTIAFAMASGVVPLCPRRAGAQEMVDHGITGLLLDPPLEPDPAAFAQALLELVDDPGHYHALREEGMKAALARYDGHGLSNRLDQLLTGIMERRPCAS